MAMAKVYIDREELSAARFAALQQARACSGPELIGTLALFWAETRQRELECAPAPEVAACLPVAPQLRDAWLADMLAVGYLTQDDAGVHIRDNEGLGAKKAAYRAAGAKGGLQRAKQARAPRTKRAPKAAKAVAMVVAPSVEVAEPLLITEGKTPAAAANARAWHAYATAYHAKLRQWPVRNAKSNALIAQVVQRIGQQDAPAVLDFYVSHPNAIFMERLYPLELAVRNIESLRTQWANGQAITRDEVEWMAKGDALERQRQRMLAADL